MIFVSYSEKDRELAEALVVDLGVLGQNVYFEEKSPGDSHCWDEIFESIEQSEAFVYTITKNTQVSYSRQLEFEHALGLGKPIIALRFEDVDLWSLPPDVPQIIDYQPQNAAVSAQLAQILNSLPPAAQTTNPIVRPSLSFALSLLHQQINVPNNGNAEKAAILLNLQEFLERRETYPTAQSLLDAFAGRIGRFGIVSEEVHQLRTQLKEVKKIEVIFLAWTCPKGTVPAGCSRGAFLVGAQFVCNENSR